jgi:3,4-dihydroxy 2-butanone 4-phosphate synthase
MSGSTIYDCLTYRNENINQALEALRAGKMIQIYDSDSREGETDLVIPAKAVTFNDVKWMRKDAGGLICVAVDPVASQQLRLPFMAELVREASKTSDVLGEVVEKEGDLKYDSHSSFSLWVNHRDTRTGIPDNERALTIRKIGEITKKSCPGIESTSETNSGLQGTLHCSGLLKVFWMSAKGRPNFQLLLPVWQELLLQW